MFAPVKFIGVLALALLFLMAGAAEHKCGKTQEEAMAGGTQFCGKKACPAGETCWRIQN